MTFFKEAIENMAASSLRCVAIAYRSYEMEKVPSNEEELDQWALPENDLVLLAIVGIKVFIFHGILIKIYTYIARVVSSVFVVLLVSRSWPHFTLCIIHVIDLAAAFSKIYHILDVSVYRFTSLSANELLLNSDLLRL